MIFREFFPKGNRNTDADTVRILGWRIDHAAHEVNRTIANEPSLPSPIELERPDDHLV
jgi:hypothetical protein